MTLKLRVQKPSGHYNEKDRYVVLKKFTSNTVKLPQSSYNPKTKKIRYGSHSQKCYACCSNKIAILYEERRAFKRNFINQSIKEATS